MILLEIDGKGILDDMTSSRSDLYNNLTNSGFQNYLELWSSLKNLIWNFEFLSEAIRRAASVESSWRRITLFDSEITE